MQEGQDRRSAPPRLPPPLATAVRRAGGDLDVVKQLLGHAHISMTERYAHVGREQLHAAVGRIGSAKIAQHNGAGAPGREVKDAEFRVVE
jgi:Phage integrase family